MPTYYQYFGLESAPFDCGSEFTSPFLGTPQRHTLNLLELSMPHPAGGFTLLTGESGVGKTTLVRQFLARHPEPAGKWGDKAVIIVDEAEDLTDTSLEDLWRLSRFEAKGEKRLHFVLIARPELITRLQSPPLREINGAIGVRATINPLPLSEASNYVDFWMKRHGGSAQRVFERRSLRFLLHESAGIPRRINILCDRAMRVACDRRGSVVTLADAQTAVTVYRNLRGSPHPPLDGGPPPGRGFTIATHGGMLVAAGMGLAAAAAVVFLLSPPSERSKAPFLARTPIKGVVGVVRAAPEMPVAFHAATFASGTNAGPLAVSSGVEPATLHGDSLPGTDATASREPGPSRLGLGQDDLIEQPPAQNLEQDSSAHPVPSPDDALPSSADTYQRAAPVQRHSRNKTYYQKPRKRLETQEIVTNNDKEDFTNGNHTQSQPDKRSDSNGNSSIQSLDPNWWIVPSSH